MNTNTTRLIDIPSTILAILYYRRRRPPVLWQDRLCGTVLFHRDWRGTHWLQCRAQSPKPCTVPTVEHAYRDSTGTHRPDYRTAATTRASTRIGGTSCQYCSIPPAASTSPGSCATTNATYRICQSCNDATTAVHAAHSAACTVCRLRSPFWR